MKDLDELINSIKHIGYIDVIKDNHVEYDLIIEYLTECKQLQQENERLNDDLEKVKFTLNLIEPEYLKLKKEKQELIEWLKLKLNQSCEEYKESIYKQLLNKLEGKE